MSIFSDNLRKYREKTGKQAKEFAKEINVLYSTYANYEQGRSEPKIDTLIKIADCLNISIDKLLGYIPKTAPNEYEYYKQWLLSTNQIEIDDSGDLIHIFFKNLDTKKFVVGALEETYHITVEKKENFIAMAKHIEDCVTTQREAIGMLDVADNFLFIIDMALKRNSIKERLKDEFMEIINSINIIDVKSNRIYDLNKYVEDYLESTKTKKSPPSEAGEEIEK